MIQETRTCYKKERWNPTYKGQEAHQSTIDYPNYQKLLHRATYQSKDAQSSYKEGQDAWRDSTEQSHNHPKINKDNL